MKTSTLVGVLKRKFLFFLTPVFSVGTEIIYLSGGMIRLWHPQDHSSLHNYTGGLETTDIFLLAHLCLLRCEEGQVPWSV